MGFAKEQPLDISCRSTLVSASRRHCRPWWRPTRDPYQLAL